MLSFGYSINKSDKCVYSKFEYEKGAVTCLYVDDMLICGTDLEKVEKTKSFISSKFSMKDIGRLMLYLTLRSLKTMMVFV